MSITRPLVVLSSQAELDALPIGSVVMALWCGPPMYWPMQKYSDGWFGFPAKTALHPLRGGLNGETVALLWPVAEEEPE